MLLRLPLCMRCMRDELRGQQAKMQLWFLFAIQGLSSFSFSSLDSRFKEGPEHVAGCGEGPERFDNPESIRCLFGLNPLSSYTRLYRQ